MAPSFKINEIVTRKTKNCSLLNSTITGTIVEVCENKLFLKIVWENNINPTLEFKRNIQRVASVIRQTSQARQTICRVRKTNLKASSDSPPKKILKASSVSPPALPETPQARRQKKSRTRKNASNNFDAPINKDARNFKVLNCISNLLLIYAYCIYFKKIYRKLLKPQWCCIYVVFVKKIAISLVYWIWTTV